MSERFKLIESIYTWETDLVISDGEEELSLKEVCDCLNKMDKQIKYLQDHIKYLQHRNVKHKCKEMDLEFKIKELENQLEKIPPKIKEVWLE